MSRSFGFDATLITFTTRAGDFSYPHDHPTPPVDAFVVYLSGATILSRGVVQWTNTHVSINSNTTGTVVALLLFGQEAQPVSVRTQPMQYNEQNGGTEGVSGVYSFPAATTATITYSWQVPSDYNGGDVTVSWMRRDTTGANTAIMARDVYRTRDVTALSTIDSAVAMNFTPSDTNAHVTSFAISAANFIAGDVLTVVLRRLGADGGDTMAGVVQHWAISVAYSASA